MNGPLIANGTLPPGADMVLSLVIGFLFGFMLEQAGFGNARKLSAVFFLRDFAVPRVMFTAILTALVGTLFLDRLGILDLTQIAVLPTYWLPQLAGGLMFGVGFLVGGFCPGTAVASAATGKIDALVFLVGIYGGMFVYAGLGPLFGDFATSTAAGTVTLPGLIGVHPGWVVLVIVLFALGFFAFANWAESRWGRFVGPQQED